MAHSMGTCRWHNKKDGGVLQRKSRSDVTESTAGEHLTEQHSGPVIFKLHSEIHGPPDSAEEALEEKKKEEEEVFSRFQFLRTPLITAVCLTYSVISVSQKKSYF